jgi:multidrug efflux pump subunit AcrA (membrane-fusion protein)
MLRSRSDNCRVGTLVAAVALLALGAGCDQGNSTQTQAQQKNAPPTVAVSQPVQRDIVEWDEYTGRFDAVETVELRARVSGHLTEVRFKDGQLVKQGDLLFVIDPRPFERALEQARAELFAATTKVENANLDIVRGKPLVERKIISDKAFDDPACRSCATPRRP